MEHREWCEENNYPGRNCNCGANPVVPEIPEMPEMPAPWLLPPLNEWAIVGMNHYHVDGKRYLFVSMEKDGRCIKAEGNDDPFIWRKLLQLTTNGQRKIR